MRGATPTSHVTHVVASRETTQHNLDHVAPMIVGWADGRRREAMPTTLRHSPRRQHCSR
jgi:hypothetical protein